jgi:hypothetical protein
VLSNDTGVVTERGPDTVRGADISFYSYARVPKGPLPDRYLGLADDEMDARDILGAVGCQNVQGEAVQKMCHRR